MSHKNFNDHKITSLVKKRLWSEWPLEQFATSTNVELVIPSTSMST
jgi:hypothetical protein